MGWFTRKVRVVMIDDATGRTFVDTTLPPENLPASFSMATMMHVRQDDWQVVHAEPTTREEYVRSGTLTLRLQRLGHLDAQDVLYSMPSICNAIPRVTDEPIGPGDLRLAQDDWRQFEFVSRQCGDAIEREIEAIWAVHGEHKAESGWRHIHMRTEPEPPIVTPLLPPAITAAMGITAIVGIGYADTPTRIRDGFAIRLSEASYLYGLVNAENQVSVLALRCGSGLAAELIEALSRFAMHHELDLVHWCRGQRARPHDVLFVRMLATP